MSITQTDNEWPKKSYPLKIKTIKMQTIKKSKEELLMTSRSIGIVVRR